MIWEIDQQPKNGIMFQGESSVRVKNKRKDLDGEADVEYGTGCGVVGPVREVQQYTPDGYPLNQPEVIDYHPTFR